MKIFRWVAVPGDIRTTSSVVYMAGIYLSSFIHLGITGHFFPLMFQQNLHTYVVAKWKEKLPNIQYQIK